VAVFVPPSTIKAASLFAAGRAAATGVISAKVAALTEGVVKAMLISKLKIATLLLVALISFGAAVKMALVTAAEPRAKENSTRPAAEKQEQPQAPPTWKIGPTLQGHGDRVWEAAFSLDGKRLASSSSDKSVVLWDIAKREAVHTLSHSGAIHSIVFAPNGKTLVTSSGWGNEDFSINVWDPETGKEQAVLKGHTDPIHRLAFSRDGKVLISAHTALSGLVPPGKRGDVCFWDMGTQKKITSLQMDSVHTAILSHDGKKLVTAHGDGTVKLWEIDEKFAATRETVIVQDRVTSLRASPDRKTFVVIPVSTPAATIDLWDFETGRILQSFEHKEGTVRDVAFSPDGKTLATGCQRKIKKGDDFELGGEVKFWDVATGEQKQAVETLGPINGLTFAPDGKTLAIGLYHKENVKLTSEEGGFVEPAAGYNGVVVLCELK
jgi:WD40 repeat protein